MCLDVGHFAPVSPLPTIHCEVTGDRNKINITGNTIQKWGVDCTRFEIQTFKPHNHGEVEKQLEFQMQAERERRKQLLDTQALQRTTLESEGGGSSSYRQKEAPNWTKKQEELNNFWGFAKTRRIILLPRSRVTVPWSVHDSQAWDQRVLAAFR
ncbi:hypothetical protein JB92DRAFT_2827990 [Gautieria morchelliformis]|nr:hypothetical protein JB92DRAFT_2827990 [Gautieria morchelliformis]